MNDSNRQPTLANSAGVRALFANAPYFLFSELLIMLMLIWLLPDAALSSVVLVWLVAWCLSALIRLWPLPGAGQANEADMLRRVRIYVGGAMFGGVLWGVLAWLLLDQPGAESFTFVLMAISAVIVLGIAAQLAWPPAWLAWAIPAVAIMADKLLGEGGLMMPLGILMGLTLLLCSGFVVRQGRMAGAQMVADGETGEMMRAMQLKQEKAEDASREKSRFLAAASHDLRQPVHTLNLLVGSLETRSHDGDTRQIVDKMREVLTGLDDLFSALLDLSRLDAAVLRPDMQVFSLRSMFASLNNEYHGAAGKKGIALSFDMQDLYVHSDPSNLWRVLSNLISNAIRYTPEGAIRLRCFPSEGRIRIAVQDTGIGITPVDLPHIFDEFHQIGNEERDRSKGLGLGLAIVRKTCDLLGCSVQVSSTPGKGSTFSILVPRGNAEDAVQQKEDAGLVGETDGSSGALSGLQVLVIDDEKDVRDGMWILLNQWGCAVTLAESGADAVAQLRESMREGEEVVPSVIIADYRLRERETGADAIIAVRRLLGKQIPAMILTGDTAPERIKEAREAGFPLMHKPVQPGRLLALIRHCLRNSKA
ncbi:MAG: ATP-binding protein [Mariprofundaceae bacterium]|nr:ATP-binding protein [Mariprofundaceae bacterium]